MTYVAMCECGMFLVDGGDIVCEDCGTEAVTLGTEEEVRRSSMRAHLNALRL